MRDLLILLVHLITTTARLMGPGGARSVIAESLLVKHQLLILNRSRQRAPNLRASDRLLAGVCSLFIRPTRVVRSAIVLQPSTILDFHRHLRTRKYRVLFSPTRRGRPGPKGPSRELVAAIVEMKRRNPRWGCPRLARQIGLAFEVPIDKDVVRRVLATRYRPASTSTGPSWRTFLGHAKDSLWSIDRFRCESATLRRRATPCASGGWGCRRGGRRRCCMNTLWGWGRASWAGCGPDVRRGGQTLIMGYSADKSPLIGHLAGPLRRLEPLVAQRQEKCGPNRPTPTGYSCNNAPFLLTNLLLDRMHASPLARIVVVSSDAHRGNLVDLDDLGFERGFRGFAAYG